MPRAAGNTGGYEFVLRNKYNGKYDRDTTIDLVSVTTVINAVFAKPMLVDWASRVTREGIAALVTLIDKGWEDENGFGLIDLLSDPEWTLEALKENGFRWQDIRDMAGDRGTAEHATLERLACAALAGDDGDADIMARKIVASGRASGYALATCDWLLSTEPEIIATEQFLYNLRYGFAGTVDLITTERTIDLKSRDSHLGPYESDHIQVGAYELCLDAMFLPVPPERSVLVIHPDGTWVEEVSEYNPDIYLDLLAVNNELRRVKQLKRDKKKGVKDTDG